MTKLTDAVWRMKAWASQHSDVTPLDGTDRGSPTFGDLRLILSALDKEGELTEAVEPLAKAADNYSDTIPDGAMLIYGEITVGHCRRARAAMTAARTKENGEDAAYLAQEAAWDDPNG